MLSICNDPIRGSIIPIVLCAGLRYRVSHCRTGLNIGQILGASLQVGCQHWSQEKRQIITAVQISGIVDSVALILLTSYYRHRLSRIQVG
jgi:hypothetical protein